MNLHDLYAAHDAGADEVTAKAVLYHLVDTGEFERLLPVLRNDVANWRRAGVRAREKAAYNYRPPAEDVTERWVREFRPLDERNGPPAWVRWKALLDDVIKVGDDGLTWGEATVDQLELRKVMYRKQIRGAEAAIDLIDTAIADLRRHGVACLNDLKEQAA